MRVEQKDVTFQLRATLLCAIVCLLGGCERKDAQPAEASRIAAPIFSGDLAADDPPPAVSASPSLVDLVHQTDVLVVSSSHRGETHQVEFLMDGLGESAWRPNSPDPAPWVELRFAHEVDVRRVSVQPSPGDQASTLGELSLRVDGFDAPTFVEGRYEFNRKLALHTKTLRLAVNGTVQGKPGAGVALAELVVRGTVPRAHVRDYALPEGRVQELGPPLLLEPDELKQWWRQAPYSSPTALCAAAAAAWKLEDGWSKASGGSSCALRKGEPKVEGTRPEHVRSVAMLDFYFGDEVSGRTLSLLTLETSAGWLPANRWSGASDEGGGCPGMAESKQSVLRTYWEGDLLVQERYRHYLASYGPLFRPEVPPSTAARSQLRCETSGRFICRETVLAHGSPDVTYSDTLQPIAKPPNVLGWERTFSVGEHGWVRFSPCETALPIEHSENGERRPSATRVVPCFARYRSAFD